MELYRQFLRAEDVIKAISKQIEEHCWSTLQEICNTIGNVKVIRLNQEQIESTLALSATPVTQKRQAKVSIHSSRCEHSPLNRTKTYQNSGSRSPLTVLKDTGKSKRQLRSRRKSIKQSVLVNVSRKSRNICHQNDSHTLKENTPEATTAVLEQKRRIPVDTSDFEPPRKRASYIKQKTVSKSNQSSASELPVSRTGKREASVDRLLEEDEDLPVDVPVPQEPPNRRSSRSQKQKTVSKSNQSSASELPVSRTGKREASVDRLLEEDEDLPVDVPVPQEPPNRRSSRSQKKTVSKSNQSSASELPVSRTGKREASVDRLLEEDEDLPVDVPVPQEPPNRRSSRSQKKTVSKSNQSSASELPVSRTGKREASVDRLLEEDEDLPVDVPVPQEPPNRRSSRSQKQKTVSKSNQSSASELPVSRTGKREASVDRLLEEDEDLPVDVPVPQEPPNRRSSRSQKKTVSKSNQSSASELPVSRTGKREASVDRLLEEDEDLPVDVPVPQEPPNRRSSRSQKNVSQSKDTDENDIQSGDRRPLNVTVTLDRHSNNANLCSSNTVEYANLKAIPAPSNFSTTTQQNNANNNNKISKLKVESPFVDLTNTIQNGVHHSSYSVDSKVKHVSRLLTGKSHQTTTFGNKIANDYNKSRLFSSAERLGGVSRLNSIGRSVQPSSKDKRDSKMNSIKERISANTSLNRSFVKQTNRPISSILSAKDKLLEEKKKLIMEHIEKKNERLRAFQEEKRLKTEARKKANDERLLAVQQRYQQLLQGNHLQVKENLPTTASTNVQAKPLQAATTTNNNNPAKKCLVSLITKDHNNILKMQNKPVSVINPAQPASIQKVHTNQPVGVLQVQKKVVEPNAVPVVEEPFNISKLNSDSESDDEDSGGHCPEWCRKGA
uniref:Uncharacterized protein n=1 Tax=Trichobilharzia regenti TaxID=157069 RepID=A0AA85JXL2_TRIRE|nr:unnamed protein product [Trichobilharzia regenti]